MKNIWLILLVVGAAFAMSGCTQSNFAMGNEPAKTPINSVCPLPDAPCHHPQKRFEDGELSFRLPENFALYKTYESEPFFAVVLKKYPAEPCGELGAGAETEATRAALQRKFPAQKVFAENSCGKLSPVEYEFAGKTDENFIAVYAGKTGTEAQKTLESARAAEPQAELKRMSARFRKIER